MKRSTLLRVCIVDSDAAVPPASLLLKNLALTRHFLDREGRFSQDLMPDYLHLSERGYQVWADGMEDVIRKLLDE
jgi:lysophospholipase L1-like esterase